MPVITKLSLDVLKPHQPNALEFATAIARIGADYRVRLTVIEVDKKTETLEVEVTGSNLDFEKVEATIGELGGALHSIDHVEVIGGAVQG